MPRPSESELRLRNLHKQTVEAMHTAAYGKTAKVRARARQLLEKLVPQLSEALADVRGEPKEVAAHSKNGYRTEETGEENDHGLG